MTSHARSASPNIARAVWFAVRVPIFLLLKVLEPVVRIVFFGLALLGVLMTLFYRAIGMPHFPFWTMLAISLGFAAVLMCYQALIRLFEA
jgi:hypothetical protein